MRILGNNRKKSPDSELYRFLGAAKSGDNEAREWMLTQYSPFVMACVSRVCGKQIIAGSDDEASIGLQAFIEAIESFDDAKGASFFTFSELVIRRRVIDYLRKNARPKNVVSLEESEGDVSTSDPTDLYEETIESIDRAKEIMRYKKHLAEYGISLDDLCNCSPKHKDARATAFGVASKIVEDPELKEIVLLKKTIPTGEILLRLSDSVNVSRKTIERHRKYIIAVFLILIGDYPYLKEYVGA